MIVAHCKLPTLHTRKMVPRSIS